MVEKSRRKEKAAAYQACVWKDMAEKYRRKDGKEREGNTKVAVDERMSLLDKSTGGEMSEMRSLGRGVDGRTGLGL
jgi:hypothetical protein